MSWLYSSTTGTTNTITLPNDLFKYTIRQTSGQVTSPLYDSRLTIQNLGINDVGLYSCQIKFNNGSVLTPSRELTLFQPDIYVSQNFRQCSQSSSQSQIISTCALFLGATAPPPTAVLSPSQSPSSPTGGGGDSLSIGVIAIIAAVCVVAVISIAVTILCVFMCACNQLCNICQFCS